MGAVVAWTHARPGCSRRTLLSSDALHRQPGPERRLMRLPWPAWLVLVITVSHKAAVERARTMWVGSVARHVHALSRTGSWAFPCHTYKQRLPLRIHTQP
jgi:hypothetical protein